MKYALSVLTMVAMLFTTSLSAFAGETETPPTGTLTVQSTNAELVNKKVSVYKVMDLVVSGTNYDYTVNADFANFFKGKVTDWDNLSDEKKNEEALSYLKTQIGSTDVTDYSNATTAKTLVDELWSYIKTANVTAKKSDITMTADGTGAKATISGLEYGYYLVFAGKTPVSLATVDGNDSTVNVKAQYPTVDKTVEDKKGTTAEIGDPVEFTLTSKVPDMTDYDTYTFIFHDTFSDGLDYDSETGVSVKVGETDLVENTGYTVTYDSSTRKLTITMLNMKTSNYTTGDDIVVTYKAIINSSAVIASTGNKNTATVEYSNDPVNGGTGTSNPSESKVYVFDIDLTKVNASGGYLKDATFELYDSLPGEDSTPMSLVEVATNQYRLATDEDTTTVSSVTTDSTGIINIKGLKQGTYYLKETKAPANYNKLQSPIPVVITATIDETTGELTSWTYTVDGTDNEAKDNHVKVVNKTGTELPSTGAMGTAIFAACGVALVIAGSMFFRKKENPAD